MEHSEAFRGRKRPRPASSPPASTATAGGSPTSPSRTPPTGREGRPRGLDRAARAERRAAASACSGSSACTTSPSRTPSTPHQHPKLEHYGDALFVVARTAQLVDGRVAFGETHLFVGQGYRRHRPARRLDLLRRRARALGELPDGARQGRGLHPLRHPRLHRGQLHAGARGDRGRGRGDRGQRAGQAADRRRHRAALHAAPRPAAPAQRRRAAGRRLPAADRADPQIEPRCTPLPRRHRPHPPGAGAHRHAARGAGLRLRGQPADGPDPAERDHEEARRPGRRSSRCRPRSPASTA